MQKFKSVDELVSQLKPVEPIYCIRKNSIQVAAKTFQNKFPGKILYAVKTNPHPEVLKTILQAGINNFDVASIKEIKDIKKIIHDLELEVKISIKSKENESPIQQKERAERNLKEEGRLRLENDSNIKAIKKVFGATVKSDSIKLKKK